MIKQQLTPERANRIFFSVQFMAILAEVIKIEHLHEMDTDFKNPSVNNFASRIAKDANTILLHLHSNPKLSFKNTDKEFTEEYAAEMHRVFRFFMGLDVQQIREYMDGIDSFQKEKKLSA